VTQCVKCQASLPDNSRFCFACGADQTGSGGEAGSASVIENLQNRLQRLVQGKYLIKRLLGKGGMGAVFLADDLTLDREVAIKVLPPDFSSDPQVIKRFQQEAKTAAKLDHVNIIPIYRVESDEGLNYFVMKFISGTSLEDLLDSKQEISYDYAQRILWEAACALGHAHSRGVVHRDVKPANIMFDHDGKVMLTDFGIGKLLQSATGLTGTGMIIGTPHYMAPEQAKGQPVDGRADQYSLGVVGYRLLSGSLPFSGDSVHTILYKHIFEEAPRLSGLRQNAPKFLTDPIQRALSKEPAQRFPTMEDFASALWPEQAVSASGKATPKPARLAPAARGPVTADTPTEHVRDASGASAPTTPLPSAVRPRTAPHRDTRPAKKSSKAGVFALVAVAAVGAGGYVVLRGGGDGGSPQDAAVIEPAPPPTPPAGQQGVAVTPESTATTPVVTPPVTPTPAPIEPATPPRQTTRPPQQRPTPPTSRPRQQQPVVQPPPAQPAVEEWGYLSINANPFGTVFIDGVNVGDTPIDRHRVRPGTHTIRIENPGYKTLTERVQVDPGNTIRKTYPLVPEG
jgi:serine/threonine-protein kinase